MFFFVTFTVEDLILCSLCQFSEFYRNLSDEATDKSFACQFLNYGIIGFGFCYIETENIIKA